MDKKGKHMKKYTVHRTEVVTVLAESADAAVRKSHSTHRYSGIDGTEVIVQKYMLNVDEIEEDEY